jgi:putative peptide zinc metalloprotease protein
MGQREKIFHDSWYRIADQRITLRPSVKIHRQVFRGEVWYVLHDPYTNQFFRFPSEVYEFIARLSSRKTVDEIWNDLVTHTPESAPTQGNIINLLSQLYQGNLIHSDLPPDSVRLFERYEKRETTKIKMTLLNLLFARIPLYDPDRLLKSIFPFIKVLFGPVGIALWVFAVGTGIKLLIDNIQIAMQQTQGILAPSNLFLLYLAIAGGKLFHEFGHSAAVRRFGGEVHTMGIMFLMLTPLPYMDATAAWAFRNKWKRLLVGASGMIFELFIAALAIIVWANTADGILHSLAYNMAVAGSVSSILFNINPLLRYDGYYMLSDLTDTPNLQQLCKKETTYLLEKYLFGKKDSVAIGMSRKESFLMVLYNLASTGYRFLVFGSLLFIVSTKILLLAIIMGTYLVISWMVVPLVKGVKYLFTDPSLSRVRGRAIQVTGAVVAAVLLFLTLIPFPFWFKAPGVLKTEAFKNVTNQTAGVVKKVYVKSGDQVCNGDTLYLMANEELKLTRKGAQAAITEVESLYRKAIHMSQAELMPLENRRKMLYEKRSHIDSQLIDLAVRAPIDGYWYSPSSVHFYNRWIPKGTLVGQLINKERFFFVSAVSQKDIGQLFMRSVTGTEIRFKGQAGSNILIDTMIIIPMEQSRLPSSALGYMKGGEIPVKTTDSSGTEVAEPFYEVRVGVIKNDRVALRHGRSGVIKISLGNQPLLFQWVRRLRQLIQKNYKV